MTVSVNTFEAEEIIQGFCSAMVNKSLYPPNHRAIRQPVEKAFEIIRSLLNVYDDLKLGIIATAFYVGDHIFYDEKKSITNFKEKFSEREIESIVFKKNVSLAEVEVLLEVLQLEPKELESQGGIEKVLVEKGVSNIHIVVLKEELDPKEVHSRALQIVTEVIDDLRSGIIPETDKAKRVVADMRNVFAKDRNALLGLTIIRNYEEYLYTHSVNVGVFSLALSQKMGLEDSVLESVALGGLFHDIGKTRVDYEVLNKPGKLTSEEFEMIKKHPIFGREIVGKMEGIDNVSAKAIIGHHVDFNLQGYPNLGLKELDPYSTIVGISDCYDALSTARCYKRALTPYESIEIMKKMSGKKFEPTILNNFIEMIGYYPAGALVRLNTNEIGVVAGSGEGEAKMIKIIFDSKDNKLAQPLVVEFEGMENEEGEVERRIVATVDPVSKGINPSDFL